MSRNQDEGPQNWSQWLFTAEQKLACARREVKQRRRAYPRWVDDKRMSQDKADYEIACMEAIAADYDRLAKQERLL